MVDERLALGALVVGQLELGVRCEAFPGPVLDASPRVGQVFEAAFPLLAVDPIPQRPRMTAPVDVSARMLAHIGRACLVGVGPVTGPVALLEDDTGAVHGERHVHTP